MKVQLAYVNSRGIPYNGQKHRSSENFTITIPSGAKFISYLARGPGATWYGKNVIFDVMKDVTWGIDPVIAKDAKSYGQTPISAYKSGESYYIANPRDGGGDIFGVEIWATWE